MLNSVWDNDPEGFSKIRSCWLNTRREEFICGFIAALEDGSTVLEIGSGTGNLLLSLAGKFKNINFIGVEPLNSYVDYSNNLAKIKSITNVKFFNCAGESVSSILKQKCRLILSNDVLHHVENLELLCSSVAKLADSRTEWIAIEPNCLNIYTFYKQATGPGERNFFPGDFLKLAKQWSLESRDFLFLIPPFIKNPPEIYKKLERSLEWLPFLAGGVALILKFKDLNTAQ